MIVASPDLLADSALALTSLLGLWALGQVVGQDQPQSMVQRRFLFAIRVVGVLMAFRLLYWSSGLAFFGGLVFLTSCLVPLAATLVVEALTARHAPRALKVWVVAGAVLLLPAPFLPLASGTTLPLLLLAGFQAVCFASLAVLVLGRDRGAMSTAQNLVLDRLSLALVVLLPLALTDFRGVVMDAPVRMSGAAVLMFCLLALDLRRSGERPSRAFATLGITFAASVAATAAVIAIAPQDARTSVQIGLVLFAIALAAQTLMAARDIRHAQSRGGLLPLLAQGPIGTRETFLNDLIHARPTADAVLLDENALHDFDTRFFEHLEQVGLLRHSDSIDDGWLAEQTAWFFRKYDATHAFFVGRQPWRLLALNFPPTAHSHDFELELAAAQRLAVRLPDGPEARDA